MESQLHKLRNRQPHNMVLLAAALALLLLAHQAPAASAAPAALKVCIMNCVQCKQMFGMYFEGKACGDACVATKGLQTPDCNDPRTLDLFIKRLEVLQDVL